MRRRTFSCYKLTDDLDVVGVFICVVGVNCGVLLLALQLFFGERALNLARHAGNQRTLGN